MSTHPSRNRRRDAFTRVELLLAMLVLGFLVVTVCPKIFARHPYAGIAAARSQISHLTTALELFQNDTGHLPVGTNGLFDLIQKPPGATNWQGPYLRDVRDVPKDPWGRDFIYECPGKHIASGYPFDLVCLGPPGETKPIANWSYPK